jgi:hypothetical protein
MRWHASSTARAGVHESRLVPPIRSSQMRGAEITMAGRDQSQCRRLGAEQEQARALDVAVAAFGFIAAEPRRLGRFLEMTGIPLESVREAAQQTHFLAGVLDHIGEDEPLLLAFVAQNEIDPNEIMRARAVLNGHCCERDMP